MLRDFDWGKSRRLATGASMAAAHTNTMMPIRPDMGMLRGRAKAQLRSTIVCKRARDCKREAVGRESE